MSTVAEPSQVLFGRTRQAVLSLFFTRPDESFYLREVARRSGCGVGPVQRELAALLGCGILTRERDKFYRANRSSPVFQPLCDLVIRTTGVVDGLKAALAPLAPNIQVAFLFGSFARGEPNAGSDVDLMLITRGPLSLGVVVEHLRAEQDRLGREINPYVISAAELARKLGAGHHFLTRVTQAPKAFLLGDEHELARLAKERLDQGTSKQPRRDRRPARAGRTRPQGRPRKRTQ